VPPISWCCPCPHYICAPPTKHYSSGPQDEHWSYVRLAAHTFRDSPYRALMASSERLLLLGLINSHTPAVGDLQKPCLLPGARRTKRAPAVVSWVWSRGKAGHSNTIVQTHLILQKHGKAVIIHCIVTNSQYTGYVSLSIALLPACLCPTTAPQATTSHST